MLQTSVAELAGFVVIRVLFNTYYIFIPHKLSPARFHEILNIIYVKRETETEKEGGREGERVREREREREGGRERERLHRLIPHLHSPVLNKPYGFCGKKHSSKYYQSHRN